MKIQSAHLLSGIFILGVLGTGLELLLLDHTEDYWQVSPLVLLGSSLVIFLLCLLMEGALIWKIFRLVMVLFIVSGFIGFWMHYQTNVEFEKEMYPSLEGIALFAESMKGATPSLAPGTMIMLGLVGWLRSFNN